MAYTYRQGFVFVQNIFAGIVSETDSEYKFELCYFFWNLLNQD